MGSIDGRAAVLVALTIGSVAPTTGFVTTAHAESGSADATERVAAFDIAAQDLAAALEAFARQADCELLFDRELTRGRTSTTVKGSLAPADALAQLLEGSGLRFRRVNARTYVVEAASTPSLAGPGEGAERFAVMVTGTRLKGGNAANTVDTLDRAEFERRGLTTTEDVARSLPQNYASRGSASSALNQNLVRTGNPLAQRGAAAIDLRGMGEGATLVLIDGRRTAASPSIGGTYVDITTIPLAAVERVDVLSGGASAIYGSDAVAGVVNFVLRRDFTGSETRGAFSVNENGGYDLDASQFLGTHWSTGSVSGGLSYRRSEPVDTSDVLTTQNFTAQGGRDFRTTTTGQPAIFTPLGRPTFATLPGVSAATFAQGQNGTGLTLANVINVSSVSSRPRIDLLPEDLTPEETQWSGYLMGSQRLGERWELTADVVYSERTTRSRDAAATIAQAILLPRVNPNNPFLEPVYVNYTLVSETAAGLMAAPSSEVTSDRTNASLGLTGVLADDWSLSASVGYGRAREDTLRNAILQDDVNPAGTAAYTALNTSDPTRALNVFGNGSTNTATILSGLLQPLTADYDNTLWTGTVQLNGTPFQLRGSPFEIVIGADIRDETLDFEDAFIVNSRPTLLPVSRTQKQVAAFAEFSVPLVTEVDGIPAVSRLELSAAGRYEKYDFDAETSQTLSADLERFTPSAGLLWQPMAALAIRTAWSEIYKVPNLNDLFRPGLNLVLPFFPDPLSPSGFATNVRFVRGGNLGLTEQTGDTITFGAEYTPLSNLRLRATYVEIDYDDLITDPFAVFNLQTILANPDQFPGTSVRSASGQLLQVNQVPVNLSTRESRSVDLGVRYDRDVGPGALTLDLQATRTLSLDVKVNATSAPVALDGTIDGPSTWRGRAAGTYTAGPLSATLAWNYDGGYDNTDPTALITEVSSYDTVDLSASWRMENWRSTFSLAVFNLFGSDFPFVDTAYGFDSRRVDVRGRRVQIAIKTTF